MMELRDQTRQKQLQGTRGCRSKRKKVGSQGRSLGVKAGLKIHTLKQQTSDKE